MTSRPPVGVLTFHRCINHGSYWQARCLVDGLRSRGHDAVILDHDSARVNRAEWKCALRPTLPTPVPPGDRPLYRAKMAKFGAAIAGLPLSQRFDLDVGPVDLPEVVVVGSDEVWNLHHPWYGRAPLFFGEGLEAARTVAYAASFGNYEPHGPIDRRWADALATFDAVAVRDTHSREIVEESTGLTPDHVLDPCLAFPPAPAKGEWSGPEQPFAAVYGHNFSPSFAARMQAWAASRNLPLVSISYRNDWCDAQWLDAGPHDFAQAIERADAVATNFFHGCVFALLGGKPFVCETSPYRQHKIRCLMADVGGEEHIVSDLTSAGEYEERLSTPRSTHTAERIRTLRAHSMEYLDRALG